MLKSFHSKRPHDEHLVTYRATLLRYGCDGEEGRRPSRVHFYVPYTATSLFLSLSLSTCMYERVAQGEGLRDKFQIMFEKVSPR